MVHDGAHDGVFLLRPDYEEDHLLFVDQGDTEEGLGALGAGALGVDDGAAAGPASRAASMTRLL